MSRDLSSNSSKDSKRSAELRQELQFLGQMASTETALFHQKAAEYYGLTITCMKAVSTLMQEGNMTAGQLATRLSLTTGAITSLLDRLEKRGIVTRNADPKDRRKIIISVNPGVLHQEGDIYESVGKDFDDLVKAYSTKELEFLVEYYKRSIELTKQNISKLVNRQS